MTHQIRILVVDDDSSVLLGLCDYLEDEGYDTVATDSAEEALALLEKHHFRVVIVDIRLPGMDGNDFVINASKISSGMEFIIHTGSTEYFLPEQLKKLGIRKEDVFNKPVGDLDVIGEAIKRKTGG
ncbi:MAG: response regulator [Desulfobacteraceae bacterium]|nr:response regulator [Desulfobacteraceae bacterium]